MDLNSQTNKTYSVLVAGDIDLTLYDLKKKVEPYVVYKYSERKEIRETAIRFYDEYIKNIQNDNTNLFLKEILLDKLEEIMEMTDEEYFEFATQGMERNKDTGDAISDINKIGKYKVLTEPSVHDTIPLKGDSFQCVKSELPKIFEKDDDIKIYSDYWDNKVLTNPNMKDDYLKIYKNKETYIKVMTEPLFYNAFVSKDNGWEEQGDEDQIQWVLNFRKRFIEKLPDNTILKVYKFTR